MSRVDPNNSTSALGGLQGDRRTLLPLSHGVSSANAGLPKRLPAYPLTRLPYFSNPSGTPFGYCSRIAS
jgi:hypothetical protein